MIINAITHPRWGLVTIFLFFFFLNGEAFGQNKWSQQLNGKILSALEGAFEVQDLKLDTLKTNSHELSHFRKVYSSDKLLGYVFVSQAPSMKNVFDYAVIFDPNLEIVKAKVLIYREQHGRQIGSVRWLKQFVGLSQKDRPSLGDEIDGISGATISCTNMTKAVHDILILIDNNIEKIKS